MEYMLQNIKINNCRIKAIDGRNDDISKYKNKHIRMSNSEIGCVLSHIKAINYLSKISGNYFLVLEDDINLDNLKYFNNDLRRIILDCPKFDILMVSKISSSIQNETYIDLKNLGIWGAAAYIITKDAVQKFIKHSKYNETTNDFVINNSLCVADRYVYNNMKTYVYKYNFIGTQDQDSEIHSNHLYSHKHSTSANMTAIIENINKI
jgi:GR25 family glycosyltransferase involved in LPS biosynthesis